MSQEKAKIHTKDKLAGALRKLGLDAMAAQAEQGYYHDFLSPLATPAMQLVTDLSVAAQQRPYQRDAIFELRVLVMNGDFDATREEWEGKGDLFT